MKRLAVTLFAALALVLSACSSPAPARAAAAPAYPTAATTGPTAWALKQHWTTKGATTLSKAGTYELIHFTGPVTITAAGVRLVNDTVVANNSDGNGITVGGANAYISRVIVSGTNKGAGRLDAGIKDKGGSAAVANTVIDRTEIKWARSDVQDVTGVVQNSYFHANGFVSGDHINGVTQNGSTQPLTITHNRILIPFDQTGAIDIFCDFGKEANVTATNNWLAGGGYTVYGGQSGNEGTNCATHNIVFKNNVFSTQFYKHSGQFGPVAYYQDNGAGNVWSGNKYSTGVAIN